MIAAIVAAIPALISLILLIVNSLKQTPAEKRIGAINDLADAIQKAKIDKDPSALAKVISNL